MGYHKEIGVYKPHPDIEPPSRIWMVTWSHDGKLLASCGEDKAVRVWQHNEVVPHLECRTVLDDSHTRAVRCVTFSHCGRYLASASFDASIIVYMKENGDYSEVNKLEGHESEIKCCRFSASDEFLASCSRDKSVWFWQMDEDEDFQVSSILQPHTQDVKSVVWHPSENLLLSCSYDYSIKFFRFDGDDWITQQKIENAHDGTVWCADFDSTGNSVVTVGEDHKVKLWQREEKAEDVTLDTWILIATYEIEDTRWPLYSVSWNKINNLVAVGGGDGTTRILKVEGKREFTTISQVHSIESHAVDVNCVSWSPTDSSLLASCGDDGTIRLTRIEE